MSSKYYNKNFRLKTEKAIEIINIYENNHSQVAKLSLLYGNYPLQEMPVKLTKVLDHSKWKKLQFIENQCKLYELDVHYMKQDTRYGLKLIFKDFTGTDILFSISTKSDPIPAEECQQRVNTEKIIKMNQLYGKNRDLLITFHSSGMTFFKFKYEFTNEDSEFQKLQRAFSESRLKMINFPTISRHSLYVELKTQRSAIKTQRSEVSILVKNKLKSPRISKKEDLESERLRSIELEKRKISQAKEKKQDISVYREKYQELKVVSQKCRGLLLQYEEFYQERKKKAKENQQSLVKLVIMANFLNNCYLKAQIHHEHIQEAVKLRSILMRAAQKFMDINKKIKQMTPIPRIRHLLTVKLLAVEQGKMLHSLCSKKSGEMLVDCLQRVSSRAVMNKLLEKATQYRIKIRTIQRSWKQRNTSQIMCFEDYIYHQTMDLYKKHPHFQSSSKEFYQSNMQKQLAWQYLKESSQKLKSIIGSYHARLEEIEQLKQANAEIRIHNKKALKKNQKALLFVPQRPPPPITRYFRDIHIMKSMVRSWFEIESRKYAKRTKQESSLKSK